MQIRDITIDDVKRGKNWEVLHPDSMLGKEFKMEDLEIVSFCQEKQPNHVVYSGLIVYLQENKAAKRSILFNLFKPAKRCLRYPPDMPENLKPDMNPIVKPLVMIKDIQTQCWDYCEYVNGNWRQVGLKPNPYVPVMIEYIANPPEYDFHFDVCNDNGSIRKCNQQGFHAWVNYMKE